MSGLRDRLFAVPHARMEIVTIEIDGQPFEVGVRQPSLLCRKRLLEKKLANKDGTDVDIGAVTNAHYLATIECAVDPEDRKLMFSPADKKTLEEDPRFVRLVDAVGNKAFEMLFPKDLKTGAVHPEKDPVEVAEKNS